MADEIIKYMFKHPSSGQWLEFINRANARRIAFELGVRVIDVRHYDKNGQFLFAAYLKVY